MRRNGGVQDGVAEHRSGISGSIRALPDNRIVGDMDIAERHGKFAIFEKDKTGMHIGMKEHLMLQNVNFLEGCMSEEK